MDHRLQKFLAVVEFGGFTRAARAVHITQPALTVAINQLEKEYGTALLRRQPGDFGLTDTGGILYASACRIRNEQRAMSQLLRTHQAQPKQIRLGMLDTLASLLFADGMSGLQPKGLEVWVDNSDRLLASLQLARLDIAIVTGNPKTMPPGMQYTPLQDEQFVFVARADRIADAQQKHIHTWLAFNQDSHTYTQFVQQFERLGIVAVPSFFSTSMDLLRSMAIAGQGTALLPEHFVRHDIATGRLCSVPSAGLARPVGCVVQKSHRMDDFLQTLIAELNARLKAN